MKISRSIIGKYVEMIWRDPMGAVKLRSYLPDRSDLPKGTASLASWKERGVVDDLTEGIVRIVHSHGTDPPMRVKGEDSSEDFSLTWVPEALIESYRVAFFRCPKCGHEEAEGSKQDAV